MVDLDPFKNDRDQFFIKDKFKKKLLKRKMYSLYVLVRPDVMLTLDDELAVDLDKNTKLPSPVMLPTAVASFTALLFNLIILMIYSIHTF